MSDDTNTNNKEFCHVSCVTFGIGDTILARGGVTERMRVVELQQPPESEIAGSRQPRLQRG